MPQFEKFKFLISDLSTDFTIYHQLFSDAEHIKTLNEFNSLIFANYQKCLLDSIYSKVSKILDPAQTGKDKNLSFAYFIREFELTKNIEIKEQLDSINQTFKDSNLKKYRNKVLSHNDAKLVESKSSFKIELNLKKLENILSSFWSLYGSIDHKSGRCEVNYTTAPHITLPRELDGYSFLSKLKNGI